MGIKTYHHRKALGLCPICARELKERVFVLCPECRVKERRRNSTPAAHAAQKRYRDKTRGKGLCDRCKKVPPREGKVLCQACADRLSADSKAVRMEKAARRECLSCPEGRSRPVAEGKTYCEHHLSKMRRNMARRRKARRDAGMCIRCGVVKEADRKSKPRCLKCQGLENKAARERRRVRKLREERRREALRRQYKEKYGNGNDNA